MRWLITALCVSLLVSGSLCVAQEAEKPASSPLTIVRAASRATKATVSKAIEAKTLVGKIAAVTLANPAKGIKPKIVVTGKSDKAITLLITSTTNIYDVGWNAVTLENLKVDSNARVKYSTTKEGTYEALAINLIK